MTEKGQKIIALRKKGKTYGEIEKILNLPKSTIAWWLRDVKISRFLQKQILERSRKKWSKNISAYNRVYGKIRSEKAAEIREKYKSKAANEIKRVSKKDIKFIGTALYWAEGNNKNRNRLQFSNADPLMIEIEMRFFREICEISNDRITARIHSYPHTDQKSALNYWPKITKLPKMQFKTPQIQISKASRGRRPQNTLPHGTLHVTVCSTELACRVQGWIRGIVKNSLRV